MEVIGITLLNLVVFILSVDDMHVCAVKHTCLGWFSLLSLVCFLSVTTCT